MYNETEDTFEIEIEVECDSCKGTGLYKGIAERDGAAVICHTCDGTGKTTFKRTFNKFKGRVKREDVNRVYSIAGEYVITDEDVNATPSGQVLFSQFGCSYADWFEKGATPKPIETLHCPYQHTNQSMQHSDHQANKLYKEECSDSLNWGLISDCKNRKNMAGCWRRYYELTGKIE